MACDASKCYDSFVPYLRGMGSVIAFVCGRKRFTEVALKSSCHTQFEIISFLPMYEPIRAGRSQFNLAKCQELWSKAFQATRKSTMGLVSLLPHDSRNVSKPNNKFIHNFIIRGHNFSIWPRPKIV